MKLTENQFLLLRRKKGELNMTVSDLSAELGISRGTLSKIINKKDHEIKPKTVNKINNWLIKESL